MRGILILGNDPLNEGRARAGKGIEVVIGDRPELLWERTLIVEAGTRIPFDLLPAAWGFLERWDAAVPLANQLAASAGTAEERRETQAVIRDLRVPLHATELLFVRRTSAGQALVAAWREGMADGGDKQLAFLRAVYQVKPRLCVLPVSWLVAVQPAATRGKVRPARPGLVRVELEPGRYVQVHAGDEERARVSFERQRKGRVRDANH